MIAPDSVRPRAPLPLLEGPTRGSAAGQRCHVDDVVKPLAVGQVGVPASGD